MKKSLLFLSAAVLASASAFAEDGDIIYDGDFVYTVINDSKSEVQVTQYNGGASVVTIPQTVYKNHEYTIVKIGNSVFSQKDNITKVNIPGTVRELGQSVFYLCPKLSSIELPDGITAIGGSCFFGTSLSSITIPDGVKLIDGKTFYNCASLTEVNMGEGVTTINADAFANCTALESITIAKGVTHIGPGAFTGCSALTEINWPEANFTIDNAAFAECNALTVVNLPANLEKLVSAPFISCDKLTEINVDEENPYFSSEDGILYNKEKQILVNFPTARGGKFWVPESVIMLGSRCFYRNTNIQGLYMSENLRYLDYGIFYGDYALADLLISPSISDISVSSIGQCKALVDLTIPAGIKSLGFGSLFNNTNLRTLIMLPEEAPEVGQNALAGLKTAQLTVYVPEGCIDKYKAKDGWQTIRNWEEIKGTISMSLAQSDITLEGDDASEQLTVDVEKDADFLRLLGAHFVSSDPSIAKVDDNGLVTPVNNGECTISVEMFDNIGGKTSGECKVFVSGVSGVEAINTFESAAVNGIYNLQGIKINANIENLPAGIYIIREGKKVSKVVVK